MIQGILKKIKWIIKRKQFAFLAEHIYIGKDCTFVGTKHISIGDYFRAGEKLQLQAWAEYRGETTGYIPKLIIGQNVSMMGNCHVSCMNEIQIGDGCLFGDNVFITDNSHGANSIDEASIIPIQRKLFSKGAVMIGRNVWVGRNVCIMPNVTIGDNVVIGANSVVTKDIPSNVIAAGAPAKVIKSIN